MNLVSGLKYDQYNFDVFKEHHILCFHLIFLISLIIQRQNQP